MEKPIACPPHVGTLLTPTDVACHNHASNLQQTFHNAHCRLLGCPRALAGSERHDGMPTHEARNAIEWLLKLGDSFLG